MTRLRPSTDLCYLNVCVWLLRFMTILFTITEFLAGWRWRGVWAKSCQRSKKKEKCRGIFSVKENQHNPALITASQEAMLCLPHSGGRTRSWHSCVWGAELIRGRPRTSNCDLPGLLFPLGARPSLPLMCLSILQRPWCSDRCLY